MRNVLSEMGLCGKLAINKNMTETEIANEIQSLFQSCFKSNKFKFKYMATLNGTKLLIFPKVNSSFQWDGAAVLSLSRGIVYVGTSSDDELATPLCEFSSRSTHSFELDVTDVSSILYLLNLNSVEVNFGCSQKYDIKLTVLFC